MPQHDLVINNGSGAAVRADLNDALAALGSTMKGPNAPPAPIAGMLWLDDDTPSATVWTLKLYDGADWLSLGTFNVSTNTFVPAGALPLAGGTLTGQLLAPSGSVTAPAYSFSGDENTGVYRVGEGEVGIANNGVMNFIVAPSGAVGIGTASPNGSRALTLNGAGNYWGVQFRVSGIPEAQIIQESTGNLYIDSGLNTTSGSTILRNNNVEVARFTGGTWNLGIGTSSPSSKLHVAGDARVTGDLLMNSGYGSAAVAYGVRAWVNFNGTGTVAIRASGNVTSITDNGTGDYTINFTNAMPDANYAVLGTVGGVSGASVAQLVAPHHSFAPTTSSLRILTGGVDSVPQDRDRICVAIVR